MPEATAEPRPLLRHCPDLFTYRRRRTREVMVGSVGVGGKNPLRLQSMTTTDTLDVEATILQSIKMIEAGCELVRITAPTVNDSRALGKIKDGLIKRGFNAPIVADIHFQPLAAMEAAEYVEKVRINPGNFVDNKRFAILEYSDAEYAEEIERIEAAFTPLVEKLKRLKRALRIGTNHGSLSDRIMNRYGDTPLGMVESALEYVRVCEKNGYHDIILSMKASNPKVMIAAYRLLAARMNELGMDYPFHLGVTEAGDGEDGRIKSAIGIGSLLEDGIGDTIRVSLTEDPEFEIPVCRALARPFELRGTTEPAAIPPQDSSRYCPDLFAYTRRKTDVLSIGPFMTGSPQLVRVITRLPGRPTAAGILKFLEDQLKNPKALEPEIIEFSIAHPKDVADLKEIRRTLASETSRLAFYGRFDCDVTLIREALPLVELTSSTKPGTEFFQAVRERGIPALITAESAQSALKQEALARECGVEALVSLIGADVSRLLKEYRRLGAGLIAAKSRAPIHIRAPQQATDEDQVLQSSILIGSLLCDGLGDSVQVESVLEPKRNLELVYNILQASGVRITKTEFVSCPSCGRTLFNLQTTTERIKSKTGHLKGVKIAIMGCIVNGPGEMADADFGYVGGAPDKINLYVGKDCVQKGIPSAVADQALIDLIKTHGKWVEPT